MSNGLHNLLICCGPIPPGGTPGCCQGRYTTCTYTTSTADYCHTHDGHLCETGSCDAAPPTPSQRPPNPDQ